MTKIAEIKQRFEQDLSLCQTLLHLQDLKSKYLGKSGELTALLKGIRDLPAEERPVFGAKVNELRNQLESELAARTAVIKEEELKRRLADEKIDISLCYM